MNELIPTAGAGLIPHDPLGAFSEFLRLDVAQGDASPATVRTYHGQVRRFVEWCEEEGLRPATATVEDIKAYRADLIETGYAKATIASRLSTLRRFFEMARQQGWRPDNPAVGIKAPRDLTDPAETRKWLPLADLQRILQAPDQTALGKRDRAILVLMALHGLRVMEVAGLDLANVDLETGEVKVHGKGNKRRTTLLVELSAVILDGWLAVRDAIEGESAFFVSVHHPDLGTRMSTRAIRKRVDLYLESLGLKREGVSCHSLRHSFATLSLAAGAELDAVGRSLGHADLRTTRIYADIVDKAAKNPARFLVGAMEKSG